LLTEPFSTLRSSLSEIPERREISVHVVVSDIGPDVLPFALGLWTRIGYVRQTMMTFRTRVGATPISARQPATVVSRDVTCGYTPWYSERPVPCVPSRSTRSPRA